MSMEIKLYKLDNEKNEDCDYIAENKNGVIGIGDSYYNAIRDLLNKLENMEEENG